MKHLDLFSGIGGFALACRMVGGIETVGFCERDNYCRQVLAKHWPDVPICNDIHEMKGNEYGTVDLITGGFPCQPYSVAGERRGNEDDRALWPQMLRVISEARPAWVLGENVPGIITLALDGVLADLEAQGYSCETLSIPACGVDAKHRRERVWIVAYDGIRESMELSRRLEACRMGVGNGGEALADTTGGEDFGRECRDVAEASGCGTSLNDAADSCGEAVPNANEIGLSLTESESLEEWTGGTSERPRAAGRRGWATEPNLGRVANGIPSRVDRLKGLGNAIVPQVAAEIIRCMKALS